MPTKRKQVKKAAKKVVKKPLTMKVLAGRIEDRRLEVLALRAQIGALDRAIKSTDDYYHDLIENNVLSRLVKLETRLEWAWFSLTLVITAFVAYTIIAS